MQSEIKPRLLHIIGKNLYKPIDILVKHWYNMFRKWGYIWIIIIVDILYILICMTKNGT